MSSLKIESMFPFMGLPFDVRRQFYIIILPQPGNPDPLAGDWVNMVGLPNPFMNLLLANKQVNEEARMVLYGLNTFTTVICPTGRLLLRSKPEGIFPNPVVLPPAFTFIKGLQLSISYGNISLAHDEPCRITLNHNGWVVRDEIQNLASTIAKSTSLKNLKVSVPCLCRKCSCNDSDQVSKVITESLQPLR